MRWPRKVAYSRLNRPQRRKGGTRIPWSIQRSAVDRAVAESALELHRQYRIKTADAFIWGTARNAGTMLITRNTKDFPETEPDIRVPYTV